MIARLSVLLPYYFQIPDGAQFNLYEYNHKGYGVLFQLPSKSDIAQGGLNPASFKIQDKDAVSANVLVVDFKKETFDLSEHAEQDPPGPIIEEVVSGFLSRVRYAIKGYKMTPVEFPRVSWHLQYLNDDESELPEQKGRIRGRGGRAFEISFMALTPELWDDIHALPPTFNPPEWSTLLLDARRALPDVGSAIVLAATSLEVFISSMLDQLAAKTRVSPTLWNWINNRDWFLKEPSTDEQFDVLLKEFSEYSLKSEASLWKAYKDLRSARNKFVHGGELSLDGKPLDVGQANALITAAETVIETIRVKLPPDIQWPIPPKRKIAVTAIQTLMVGDDKDS